MIIREWSPSYDDKLEEIVKHINWYIEKNLADYFGTVALHHRYNYDFSKCKQQVRTIGYANATDDLGAFPTTYNVSIDINRTFLNANCYCMRLYIWLRLYIWFWAGKCWSLKKEWCYWLLTLNLKTYLRSNIIHDLQFIHKFTINCVLFSS